MRSVYIAISLLSLAAAGCSRSPKTSNVLFAAGDKATVGPLVYSVTDTEVAQQLGDDANPRTAQERFYLIRVSVSNSSSDDQSIPTMTLVDDAGHNYTELPDGSGVTNWLGVVRKVRATQTEQGVVVFDAPTKHYRLRINDAIDDNEIAIDVPLNFVHERLKALDTNPGTPAAGLSIPNKK
jgi:hypothetical protein